MKISARRDGDHARRAGLARPPDVHHRPRRRCPLVVGVTAVDFRSYFSGCQLLRASPREVRRLRDLEAVQTRCGEAWIWRWETGLGAASTPDVRVGELLRRTPAVRLHIAYQDLVSYGCAKKSYWSFEALYVEAPTLR